MTRKHILVACLVFALLTVAVAGMGYRAKTDVEALVTEQFNTQQLLLAQKIAEDIVDHVAFLRTSLEDMAPGWRDAASDGKPWLPGPALLGPLARWNVVALGVQTPGEARPRFFEPSGAALDAAGLCPAACGDVLAATEGPGHVATGRAFTPSEGPFAGRRLLPMAISLDDARARPGGVILVVDALAVAARYAHGVQSGRPGYAWVVDDKGVFLDHYETDFIGRDSLDVRRERNPDIDWSRLRWLIEKRVMAGERGTDWYVSGWHRGRVGEVKKYAAFCPAFLDPGRDAGNRWAVALAAPQDEVEGLIGRLVVRQWLLVGLFELMVFAGFATVMHFALRWNTTLSREVDKTARELLGAQEKLIRSERFAAIGEAAARLSHEIKNPLMLMGGFAGPVRRHLAEDDKDAEKLAIIEAEAKRLESLLNEVRDFTRPAAPHIEARDINETVRGSLAVMRPALEARGIVPEVRLDTSLPPVPHDADRMRQVLLNLMKNAAEAMEGGGRLVIASESVAGKFRLTVADTGGGIPESVRARVFDPFCTTKESGTGLGLAVCQRIVEDHRGDIRFVTGDAGTTFIVELPLAQERTPDLP